MLKRIFLICILFLEILYSNDLILKTQFNKESECSINSFIINDIYLLGVGRVFDDTTLENKACIVKYDLKAKKLIYEKIFSDIDNFYKIIKFENEYFLLASKLLSSERNIGRTYADRGYTGILIKMNETEKIEKKVEIDLDGFGNVRDILIQNNMIYILSMVKKSTIYDENIYADIIIKNFNIDLSFIKNLKLQSNEFLANNFYPYNNEFIIRDDFHNKTCLFDNSGNMVKCFEDDEMKVNIKNIFRIEYLKEKYQISAYDDKFQYALKEKTNGKNLVIQYLYEIEVK